MYWVLENLVWCGVTYLVAAFFFSWSPFNQSYNIKSVIKNPVFKNPIVRLLGFIVIISFLVYEIGDNPLKIQEILDLNSEIKLKITKLNFL